MKVAFVSRYDRTTGPLSFWSLFPVFSGQLPFAVSESPPQNASFTFPRGNFLQVFLTFQEANRQIPLLWKFRRLLSALSRRVLNLSALQPSLSAFPDLYAFSVSFWSAIPPTPCLARRFPALSSVSPILEEVLREQELRTLFAETPHFSRKLPAESLPCVPSTGCCSAKNASMNSRRSPMIRKLCEIYSGSFGQRDFSHTKRTRAAYTGPRRKVYMKKHHCFVETYYRFQL